MDGILLLGPKSCIQDMKFKIYQVSISIPAVKSQNIANISGTQKPTWAKYLEFDFFFYLKRQGYIDITRTKINFGGHIIFIHNLAMTFLIKLQNSKNNQNRANMKFYSASCFYPKSRGKNGTSLKAIFLKSKIHRSKPSSVL